MDEAPTAVKSVYDRLFELYQRLEAQGYTRRISVNAGAELYVANLTSYPGIISMSDINYTAVLSDPADNTFGVWLDDNVPPFFARAVRTANDRRQSRPVVAIDHTGSVVDYDPAQLDAAMESFLTANGV